MWPLPVCLPVCLSNHHKSELCEWNKWIREWSCDYFRKIQHEDTKETSMDVFKLHDDKHAKIGNNNNFIQTAFINVDWHTVIMKASCENTVQTSQNRTLPTHHKVTCWDGSRPDPTWPISTWRVENETQNSSFPTDETFESWTRLDFIWVHLMISLWISVFHPKQSAELFTSETSLCCVRSESRRSVFCWYITKAWARLSGDDRLGISSQFIFAEHQLGRAPTWLQLNNCDASLPVLKSLSPDWSGVWTLFAVTTREIRIILVKRVYTLQTDSNASVYRGAVGRSGPAADRHSLSSNTL